MSNNLTPEETIERYLEDVRQKSIQYADAKGDLVRMEHGRKSILAMEMRNAELKGAKTAAAQDRDAHASSQYQEYVLGLSAATEKEALLRWELKMAEWKLELYRTTEATRRMEMKGYRV